LDNQGGALIVGATYFSSTTNTMYVYNGSTWSAISSATSYSAPTLGSTTINSGTTYSTITGLTLSGGLATADPTASLGLATKQYVDLVTAGVNYHAPVIAASVSNLSANYNNGTSGVGATLTADTNRAFSTLDGQTVSVGQRILIKDQTTQFQNGIYTLTTVGSGAAPWVITRATDNDQIPEIANGDVINVTGGTANSGKTFVNSSAATIVVGTTAITFASYYTGLPSQTGSAGYALTTDGTTPSWSTTINGTAIPATKTLVVTTDKLSVHATTTSAELAGVISDKTGTGVVVFNASPTLTPTSAANIGLTVKGLASQSANLQEWQNSSGALVASMGPSGNLAIYGNGITSGDHRIGTASYLNATLNVASRTTTEIGTVIRGYASQTANLQEWQNSAGTVLASVTASGDIKLSASGAFGSITDYQTLNLMGAL
jgi:hypothetical protein